MKSFCSAVSGSAIAPVFVLALALAAPGFAQTVTDGEIDLGAANCRLVPSRDSNLSVGVREIIETVAHRLGGVVAEGDVLLTLSTGSMEAQVRQSEVTLDTIRQRRERAEQMRNVLSVAELSELESELLIAQIQYDGLLAERARYLLRAPHDGVVIELFADVGEFAPDGPLVRLVQVDTLRAELDVPGYLRDALDGSDALLVELADGRRVDAEISFRDVLIEPVSQTFRLHALIDNPDGSIIAGTACRAYLPAG